MTNQAETKQVCSWNENLDAGIALVAEMARAVYQCEGKAQAMRTFVNMYPDTVTDHTKGASSSIQDVPEYNEGEKEHEFRANLKDLKENVGILSQFLVSSLDEKINKCTLISRFYPTTSFSQPQHEDYAVKAQLYEIFLDAFESETFGAPVAWSEFASNPKLRAAKYYQYYRAGSEITDFDYTDWVQKRFASFCRVFTTNMGWLASYQGVVDVDRLLKEMGGPYMASCFNAVCKSCWALQTLACAFEEPATKFSVEIEEEFDDEFMEPVISTESRDNDELVVGFMVAPGFFIRESVIPAEVYLV